MTIDVIDVREEKRRKEKKEEGSREGSAGRYSSSITIDVTVVV